MKGQRRRVDQERAGALALTAVTMLWRWCWARCSCQRAREAHSPGSPGPARAFSLFALAPTAPPETARPEPIGRARPSTSKPPPACCAPPSARPHQRRPAAAPCAPPARSLSHLRSRRRQCQRAYARRPPASPFAEMVRRHQWARHTLDQAASAKIPRNEHPISTGRMHNTMLPAWPAEWPAKANRQHPPADSCPAERDAATTSRPSRQKLPEMSELAQTQLEKETSSNRMQPRRAVRVPRHLGTAMPLRQPGSRGAAGDERVQLRGTTQPNPSVAREKNKKQRTEVGRSENPSFSCCRACNSSCQTVT